MAAQCKEGGFGCQLRATTSPLLSLQSDINQQEDDDDDYDKDADDILICLETLCENEEDGYIDHHIT